MVGLSRKEVCRGLEIFFKTFLGFVDAIQSVFEICHRKEKDVLLRAAGRLCLHAMDGIPYIASDTIFLTE